MFKCCRYELDNDVAIGEVLEAVVQSCGERVYSCVHQAVEVLCQLFFSHAHMEATLECWNYRCSGPKACQLTACKERRECCLHPKDTMHASIHMNVICCVEQEGVRIILLFQE